MKKKVLLVLGLVAIFCLLKIFHFDNYLSLAAIKAEQARFSSLYASHPYLVVGAYLLVYIISTAVSFPGATILTLLGGALFGVILGTILVSFASTCGATLACISSRYLFKESAEKKFRNQLEAVNRGLEKEGAFYLFALRLVPLFPFFAINLVMGLTKFQLSRFFWVSQLGMLPGTIAYVNAGTQLSSISSLKGILSPPVLISFAALGLIPLVLKKSLQFYKRNQVLKKYKKPKKFDYNLIVIGAGSAGLVSSYIAAAVKAKVALIERHKMGGDCLYTGCVPSKSLIATTKVLSYQARSQEFGLRKLSAEFDFADIMERVQEKIRKIEPHDSKERYTKLGVECISGDAKLISPYEVEVNGKVLTTRSIIIATGAVPIVPNLPGIHESGYLTSDTVWSLRVLPKRLIVLGGGPIGCELALCFARLGAEVVQVQLGPRILPREDLQVSDLLKSSFEREGIRVLLNHKAIRCQQKGEQKFLVCESNGKELVIPYDGLILALGRKANIDTFGGGELGIQLTSRGTIETDEYLCTAIPTIHACGDVVGPYQFTHMAAHQAWFATVNSLFGSFKKFKVDYRVVPWSTFTDPEVARVGLNELEANEKNIPHEITTYSLDDLDRAITDSEDRGFVKVLTTPGSDKIIGVTIMGAHAGDLIMEFILAMKHGLGLKKVMATTHIYPTMVEGNKYAAGEWQRANQPVRLLGWVSKFHSWRRR